jgi:hypothetical protein
MPKEASNRVIYTKAYFCKHICWHSYLVATQTWIQCTIRHVVTRTPVYKTCLPIRTLAYKRSMTFRTHICFRTLQKPHKNMTHKHHSPFKNQEQILSKIIFPLYKNLKVTKSSHRHDWVIDCGNQHQQQNRITVSLWVLLEEQEFWWFVFSTTFTNLSPVKDLIIIYLC